MKKLAFILAVVIGTVAFTSCSGGYSCPTYLEHQPETMDKVQV